MSPQPWGHPCPPGRARIGDRDVPSGGHQRLELPLVLLTVEVQAVHDLVLLFWWDEVLDDQVPERVSGQETHGAGEDGVNVTSDRKQVGKGEERDVGKRGRQENGKTSRRWRQDRNGAVEAINVANREAGAGGQGRGGRRLCQPPDPLPPQETKENSRVQNRPQGNLFCPHSGGQIEQLQKILVS